MTHQYKKLPVTMKMWTQFNVMPWTSLSVDGMHPQKVTQKTSIQFHNKTLTTENQTSNDSKLQISSFNKIEFN